MPNPPKAPVARLAGVIRPGEPRPMPEQDMPDHVAVLREGAEGWRSVPVAPGMALHDGDVVRLKGEHFGALGARAFTVGSPGFGDTFGAAPAALDLLPHEAVHTVQQGYGVVPLNDADAERIERAAEAAESLAPPKAPGGR